MSAGRYVAFDSWWNEQSGPFKQVEEDVAKGEYPAGTKCVSFSMNRSHTGETRQVIGLQFTSARTAAGWIAEQEHVFGEVGDQFHRFSTMRELDGYLDDTSMATYLKL